MRLIATKSCLTTSQANHAVMHRTILAIGAEAVERFATICVGIIGLGGLGIILAELLSRLGIRCFVLCETDSVELSNLNRLLGATTVDATLGTPKVMVGARMIYANNPSAHVQIVQGDFLERAHQEAFKNCDVIFGCVDTMAPRLAACHLCLANGIVYLDLGCGATVENGRLSACGGQVIKITPGAGTCLKCDNIFDFSHVEVEFASPEESARQRAAGYASGEFVPQPSVYALNMQIASTAVWMMMRLTAGEPLDFDGVYLDALNFQASPWSSKNQRSEQERNNCALCGEDGFEFGGDDADLLTRQLTRAEEMELVPENCPSVAEKDATNDDSLRPEDDQVGN